MEDKDIKALQKENEKFKKQVEDFEKERTDLINKHAQAVQDLNAAHEKQVQDLADKIQKQSAIPMTDTAAKQEAQAELNKTAGASIVTMGNASLIVDDRKIPTHPNDVKFNVTTPKETGMQKGITVVSKEVAEHFESLGIGKIVK